MLQKDYIKVNKFYEMHIFHGLFTILKEQKLQFYHKVLKFSAEIIKMWKTFLSCHVYINLSTSFVDNCVDKTGIFGLYIFRDLWYNWHMRIFDLQNSEEFSTLLQSFRLHMPIDGVAKIPLRASIFAPGKIVWMLKGFGNFEDIKRNRCVFALSCNVLTCVHFLHRKRSVHI